METFADVLHAIIDAVFGGDVAAKAHTIIDSASGPRTAEEDLAEPRLLDRGRGGRIGRGLGQVLLGGAGPRGRVDDGVGLGGHVAAEHGVDDGVEYVSKSFHVGRRYFLRVAMTTAVKDSTPDTPEMTMAASAMSASYAWLPWR